MKKNIINKAFCKYAVFALAIVGFSSCEDEYKDLPEVGDLVDLTLPESSVASALSSFSINSDEEFKLVYELTSDSPSGVHYRWTLPEGASIFIPTYEETLSADELSDFLELDEDDQTEILDAYKAEIDLIEADNEIEELLPLNSENGTLIQADSYQKTILVEFEEEKDYEIEFAVFDDNGVISTGTHIITAIAGTPVPSIINLTLDDGSDAGRQPWRDWWWDLSDAADLGSDYPSTTGDTFNDSPNAFKFEINDHMIQYFAVTPGKKFRFTFYYTIEDKNDGAGEVYFTVLSDRIIDANDYDDLILGTVTGDIESVDDGKDWYSTTLEFDSGANEEVGLLVLTNSLETIRVDEFEIQVVE